MNDLTKEVGLPPHLRDEFEAARGNACVGQVLVSESERVRVWSIRLRPGERIAFHRHVLDYFWTAITSGRAKSHTDGKTPQYVSYEAGDTRHHVYGPGESKIHDLENVGDTELAFVTVEFLQSANAPLTVPDTVRRPGPAGAAA